MSPKISHISCACGALYERREAHLPIKDVGVYECDYCGIVLERWHGRVVPVFRMTASPEGERVTAVCA